MGAVYPAIAFDYWRGKHARFAQEFEADACAHDIDYRVYPAHFMEVNLLGRQAVNFAFGDRDPVENSDGLLFDPLG